MLFQFWGCFVKIGIITCKNRIQNVVCLFGGGVFRDIFNLMGTLTLDK